MNTLDRYIGKTILSAIFLVLLLLSGISGIIKFVEQFRQVGKGTYDLWQAVLFTVLTVPRDLETFFPMAALIGSMIALGNLASRSELVVMQAAGLSRFTIALAVIKTALPLVIFTMIIAEWGVPQAEQFARDMRERAISGGSMLSLQNGVWAKDGQNFVFVRHISDDGKLEDVYIYTFNQDRQLTHLKHANSATFSTDEHKWQLRQVNNSSILPDEVQTTHRLNEDWQSSLTPDKLGAVSLRPTSLSMSGLYEYIAFLKQTGQDARRFELTFWRKIIQPFSVGIMMMLGLSFIFGSQRNTKSGVRLVIGIVAGFVFYATNEIFGQISVVYQISPIFGAMLPSLLFMLLVWRLLTKARN